MMRYTISLTLASLALGTAALAEVPRVVTDIPPVHSLVAQVMGDLGTPDLLLGQGADAHSFQLRPSQAQALSEAGLIVWIGPEMTPWLDRTLGGLGAKGAQLRLLAAEGTETRSYGGAEENHGHDEHAAEGHDHGAEGHDHGAEGHDHGAEGHDHGAEGHDHDDHARGAEGHDEAGHDEAGHDHDDHGHVHSGTDPHAWLDPANAGLWLGLIAGELSRIDPDNAAVYAANAAAAQEAARALDAELAATLAPAKGKGKPIVLFHDAYGYFAAHYGLNVAGTVALGDASSPGAARLSELRTGLEGGAALCIFPEAQHDPKLVVQMAEGTGVTLGGALDPEGSTLEPGAALYGALMRGLAGTIAACAGG
jgi:zinc transport system substrate-binding protein